MIRIAASVPIVDWLAKSNSHLYVVPATNLQLRLESQRESHSVGHKEIFPYRLLLAISRTLWPSLLTTDLQPMMLTIWRVVLVETAEGNWRRTLWLHRLFTQWRNPLGPRTLLTTNTRGDKGLVAWLGEGGRILGSSVFREVLDIAPLCIPFWLPGKRV